MRLFTLLFYGSLLCSVGACAPKLYLKPEASALTTYTQQLEYDMEILAMGQKIELHVYCTGAASLQQKSTGWRYQSQIQELNAHVEGGGQNISYNSTTSSEPPTSIAYMQELLQNHLDLHLSPNGEVTPISQPKGDTTKSDYVSLYQTLLSALEASWVYIPHEKVSIGDSWGKTRSFENNEIPFSFTRMYTLSELREERVRLDFSGTTRADASAAGTEYAHVHGEEEGTVFLQRKTRQPLESTWTRRMQLDEQGDITMTTTVRLQLTPRL